MRRAIVCAAAFGAAASAQGAIINVGPGQSIQAAINLAAPGDTVVVAPGTYHQSINFAGKAIMVRSSGGPQSTSLDGTGLQVSVVTFITSESAAAVLEGFTITKGEGTLVGTKHVGGGMRMAGASATVRNCTFIDNHSDEGGAAHIVGGQPTVIDCRFVGNSHAQAGQGGGAIYTGSSFLKLISCALEDNVAASLGGAVLNVSGFPSLINCVFSGNSGLMGGAIFTSQGFPTLINCTIAGNTSVASGGGMRTNANTATLYNCIFWDNVPNQVYSSSDSTTTLHYCNVMGGWAGPGSNNMNQPPLFENAAGGDYHLAPNSPCMNQGSNSAVPPEIETDLDGLPRFVGAVDMGPYEVQVQASCPWDLNGNGDVTTADLLSLLSQWGTAPGGPPDFDGNNIVNTGDMLALLAHWGPCP